MTEKLWTPPPVELLRPVRGRIVLLEGSDRAMQAACRLVADPDAPRAAILARGRILHDDHNLYVNLGYARLAAFLAANSATPAIPTPQYIGVGLSATAPAAADTLMGAEISRKAITSASVQSTYTARLATTFLTTEVVYTLREIGLWDSAGGANGTATGGSTTTLVDSGASFGASGAQIGNTLTVVTAAGAVRYTVAITASTGTQLTFAIQGTSTISGDKYFIAPSTSKLYGHGAVSVVKSSAQSLLVLWLLTLPSQ